MITTLSELHHDFKQEPIISKTAGPNITGLSLADVTMSYVNYSNIAAKILRKSLKSNLKEEAAKRDQTLINCFYWSNGEMLPAGQKPAEEKDKT